MSPKALSMRARVVGLAEAAQAVGRRDARRAAPTGSSSTARRYLVSAAALSPAISSICASIDQRPAPGRAHCRGFSLARTARAPTKSFWPARSQATHVVAQRPELVLRADAAELLLGGAIVALLDLLDGQHEVGEPVARLGGQDLRRELRGGVDPAGIECAGGRWRRAARGRRAPAPARGRAGRRRSRSRDPARRRGRRGSGR